MNNDKLNNEISKISDLGTINGINRLTELLGENYIYPKISFFSLDYGMFREEDSHFVLYNSTITINKNFISFIDGKRNPKIEYVSPIDRNFFNGNKRGFVNLDINRVIRFIEFSNEDYFIEIAFDENDLYEGLNK